jgi:pyruvate formate lyase activating enzyme
MKIGGLQKTSLIDFPGKISCIIFTQGCNLRCPYCHNPELVLPESFLPPLDMGEIVSFLKKRRGYLDGVSITGGEPCLYGEGLLSFMKSLKDMGYLVKLDTNGTFPGVVEKAVKERLVDYLAMDVKGPLEKYEVVAGVKVDVKSIERSIDLIKGSDISYEFKTTTVKELIALNDFEKIGKLIKGANLYYIQRFIPTKTVDPKGLSYHTYSDEELETIRRIMLQYVQECYVR